MGKREKLVKEMKENPIDLKYPFTVRPALEDEGGGYIVEFLDLPFCIGTGNTRSN